MSNPTQYTPDNLPKTFETQVFVTYELSKYSQGQIKVWDCDVSGSDRILLCSPKIKIKLPAGLDLKAQMLVSLEAEKSRLLADTHMKVKEIQEKINELLCIEYKPMAGEMPVVQESVNEIPF